MTEENIKKEKLSTAPNIFLSMGQVMKNIGGVGKTKNVVMNGKKGYAYRSIEDIVINIHPLLADFNIFLLPEVLDYRESTNKVEKEYNGKKSTRIDTHAVVKMRYHFVSAIDGSKVSADGIGESMDTSDKAYGKATTYALKNVLADVFVIPIDDPKRDPDHVNNPRTTEAPPAKANQQQLDNMVQWAVDRDIPNQKLLDLAGKKNLNDFTVADLSKVHKALIAEGYTS